MAPKKEGGASKAKGGAATVDKLKRKLAQLQREQEADHLEFEKLAELQIHTAKSLRKLEAARKTDAKELAAALEDAERLRAERDDARMMIRELRGVEKALAEARTKLERLQIERDAAFAKAKRLSGADWKIADLVAEHEQELAAVELDRDTVEQELRAKMDEVDAKVSNAVAERKAALEAALKKVRNGRTKRTAQGLLRGIK